MSPSAAGIVVALAAVMLAACSDRGPLSSASGMRARLQLSASIEAAGEQLDIAVSYQRTSGNPVAMLAKRVAITAGTTEQIDVTIDLAPCLADAARATLPSAGCPLLVDVVLRDADNVRIDSARVGPLDVTPDAPVATPTIRLQSAASLEVRDGDAQLAWVGQPLFHPIVLRMLDREGEPIARRAVEVTAPPGGAVLSTGPLVTDDTGVVSIRLRAGPSPGAQPFTVRSLGGGTAAIRIASVHGVSLPRRRLAVGAAHSCYATFAGVGYCWGSLNNLHGELGNPQAGGSALPGPVATSQSFVAMSAAENNSILNRSVCGLTAGGDVYCWGSNDQGLLGVPATGTCLAQGTFPATSCTTTPQRVPAALNAAVLSVGGHRGGQPTIVQAGFACAINGSGNVLCWGVGDGGAIGDGTFQSRTTPTPVATNERFVDVATGDDFACAVSARATVWCWGANNAGQLGDGGTTNSATPTPIASPTRFVAVAAGPSTVCAIDTSGAVWCWGRSLVSQEVDVPTRVPGNTAFVRIDVGNNFACGVAATGEARCWGRGLTGQLGSGRLSDTLTTPMSVVGLPSGATAISVGLFGACAEILSQDLYCWGGSAYGQLGIGSTSAATGVPVASLVNLTGIAVGDPAVMLPLNGASGLTGSTGSSTYLGGSMIVAVRDARGLGVGGVQLQQSIVSGGGTASAQSFVTSASGVAVVPPAVLGPQPVQNIVRVSVASNPTVGYNFSIEGVTPGPPAQLLCGICSTTVAAGSPSILTLPSFTVRDASGYVVANRDVVFTGLRPGISTTPALPATLLSNANGVVQLTAWQPDVVARSDSILVSTAGAPSVYLVLRVLPASPQRLVFFSAGQLTGIPVGQVVGPLVLHFLDPYGNITTNQTATTVTLSIQSGPPGGALVGTTTVTSSAGVATFSDVSFSAPGTYQLVATSGSLTTTPLAFGVVP